MKQVTAHIEDETLQRVDTMKEDGDYRNRSEVIRELLDRAFKYPDVAEQAEDLEREVSILEGQLSDLDTKEERIAELEAEVEQLEARLQEANNRLEAALNIKDEHTTLVEYVEEERSHEQRLREAGVLTRTKWWVTGVPEDS